MKHFGILVLCLAMPLAHAGAAVYPHMAPLGQYGTSSRTE